MKKQRDRAEKIGAKKYHSGIAFLLSFLFLLSSCTPALISEPETELPKETEEKITQKTTEQKDPRGDGEMNILIVGQSASYYWTDELWGMLDAAGYENVSVCDVYYSGCTLQRHYEFWRSKSTKYHFRIFDQNGLKTIKEIDLDTCLESKNWDYIGTLNGMAANLKPGGLNYARNSCEPYLKLLYQDWTSRFPNAKYFWQQIWAAEVGYQTSSVFVETKELREEMHHTSATVAREICQKYNMDLVPLGDAWQKVRDLPLFRTPVTEGEFQEYTLCTRIRSGKIMDDYGHDGDIGGGQYLNACVYFEVLTGKSCVGNTFRPQYILDTKDLSLTEEKIAILQQAAHEAVEEAKAEMAAFAK